MTKPRPSLWQRLKNILKPPQTPETQQSLQSQDNHLASESHTSNTAMPLVKKPATKSGAMAQSKTIHSRTDNPSATMTNPAFMAEHTGDSAQQFSEMAMTEMTQITETTWDLTEDQHRLNSSEPISPIISVADIEALLDNLGYYFTYHPVISQLDKDPDDSAEQAIHHFTMQVSDKEHEWGCMIRYFAEQQLIAVYSILPFAVPTSHMAEMMTVITQLNYEMVIGNLEIDAMDGELRFKTSLDLEVTGANELVLSYLLQSNFSLTSRLYEVLETVIKKEQPNTDIQTILQALKLKQQESSFYVMSERVQ